MGREIGSEFLPITASILGLGHFGLADEERLADFDHVFILSLLPFRFRVGRAHGELARLDAEQHHADGVGQGPGGLGFFFAGQRQAENGCEQKQERQVGLHDLCSLRKGGTQLVYGSDHNRDKEAESLRIPSPRYSRGRGGAAFAPLAKS